MSPAAGTPSLPPSLLPPPVPLVPPTRPAPPRVSSRHPPRGAAPGQGVSGGSQAPPQGAIAPRGTAAPRSLFRAPWGGQGGEFPGWGQAPALLPHRGVPPGSVGPGGQGGLSWAGDLHSGPCSSTKVHEVIGGAGGYFRFLPQYFPCAQPTPPGLGGGTPGQPPRAPAGGLEAGQGWRGTRRRSPLKPRAPRAPPKVLGGFPAGTRRRG